MIRFENSQFPDGQPKIIVWNDKHYFGEIFRTTKGMVFNPAGCTVVPTEYMATLLDKMREQESVCVF